MGVRYQVLVWPGEQFFPVLCSQDRLEQHLQDFVATFFRPEQGVRVEEKEIWLNVYSKGDYQEVHNHLGMRTIISMAYMLELRRNSGSFVFPLNGDSHFRSLSDFVRPDFSRERFVPALKEDQAVFVPSFLPHYVTAHSTRALRATISANYDLTHPLLEGEEKGS
ncbi:MAG: putative 2OG-Fe(II) oxygenase [Verrucomicrobiota bacterium]